MDDPVWKLFSRRSFSRLAYWLSVLGYDLRDRSVSNRIYLVYFCIFWLVWTIAVLVLLGGGAASVLGALQFLQTQPVMVRTLGEVIAAAWVVAVFGMVIRRSPFVFSEEDAYLLCQTPVSRRKVALAWLAQDLIVTLMVSGLGAVILAFALVEWRSPGEVPVARIFEYLRAAAQALPPVWAVLTGWQAALWGLGSLRLSGRAAFAHPRLIAILAAVGLLLAAVLVPGLQAAIAFPFRLPLAAAFAHPVTGPLWWGGLAQGMITLAVGSAFFLSQSGRIHLGRAAQETRQLALLSQARLFGQQDLIDAILLRRRLSATRAPSRLLAQERGGVLFWKDVLQMLRALRLKDVSSLIWIFTLSLAMFGPTNAALRMVLAGVWAISTGGFITRRLRSDLARWWLARSLPVAARSFFAQDFALSWGIVTLMGWLALGFSPAAPEFRLGAAVLLPVMAANAGLAAAQDILGHAQARILMSPSLGEENVPRQNIGGAILGLVSVLAPFGVLVWFALQSPQPVIALAAVPVGVAISWLNLRAVLSAYRWIH